MKVIIVGGGIGGLAAAIGLRRAGHHVTIFERSSFLHEIGAAINICPNAYRVLSHWGFNVDLARTVTARQSMVAHGSSLKPVTQVDCSKCGEAYGAPWLLVHRVDLHSELRRLATSEEGPGLPVEIVLNSKVVGYDPLEGSVTLADGSVCGADLVVAADGVHTSAMHHVNGHATRPVSTGSAVFRFLLSKEDLPNDPTLEAHFGDGVMRVMAAEGVRRLVWYPCANNTVLNFVGIHPNDHMSDHEQESWDRSATVNDVLAQYHDFHPSILKIIRKATNIKRWPLLYREPVPSWSRDRLVLIGDAAHPMLPHQGQGGGQAIEDAGALSVIFTRLPAKPTADDIRDRLAVFERVRIKRASVMQIFSNAGQDQAWKIREDAQQYMPEGVDVPSSPLEFMEYNFSYDVLKDSREQLAAFLEKS
ncbi:hypothetical protein BDV26DRAFT_293950 [Aspergillus bertholletiae]|uniref:FAD-binding domain-containing protein n=1 Tax=Aspergillus bertholletiae TaxID=1226010 RepID=A0A5N7B3F0_9EURO|nr:hypothetical protein BDV26DRAFT_293950 [Aspergillus bertholletiae]